MSKTLTHYSSTEIKQMMKEQCERELEKITDFYNKQLDTMRIVTIDLDKRVERIEKMINELWRQNGLKTNK